MLRLHLVRHGHTIWNDTGGVAGRTDIGLSEKGQQAVTDLARTWSPIDHLDSWHSSPLLRTRHTTQLLREGGFQSHELPEVLIDERLVELDFGRWEGMTWQSVHENYQQEMDLWGQDWVNRSPPDGETFSHQAARCEAFLNTLVDGFQSDTSLSAHHAMVVLHGGSIRALVCLCLGWPLTQAMSFQVDPATVTTLDLSDGDAGWTLRQLNSRNFKSD